MGADQPRPFVATGHTEQGALLTGWQPIETAPRMSHVILWFPSGQHVIALVNGPTYYETVGYFGPDGPTHWMPLPPPPA